MTALKTVDGTGAIHGAVEEIPFVGMEVHSCGECGDACEAEGTCERCDDEHRVARGLVTRLIDGGVAVGPEVAEAA